MPAVLALTRTTVLNTSGAGRAESGSRFNIPQQLSRIVTATVGAVSPLPNAAHHPPTHLPGRDSSVVSGRQRSGEIVGRPNPALRVVRSLGLYRSRSRRWAFHRRCHASTA